MNYKLTTIILFLVINKVFAQNVGIGTNTPEATLEVVSPNSNSSAGFIVKNSNNNKTLRILNDKKVTINYDPPVGIIPGRTLSIQGTGINFYKDDDQFYGFISPTLTGLGIGTGLSEGLDNLALQENGGNLGIGTRNPEEKLHVNGNALIVGSVQIKSTALNVKLKVQNGIDASLANGTGYVVLGEETDQNLVIDNNEIISRNNGANSILHLQNTGGDTYLGGNAFKPGGGSWGTTSDIRLKQNIKPYNDGLQHVLKINPVMFNYNDKSGYNTDSQHVGVIAQDLQQVASYMVGTYKKDGKEYLSVDNSAMIYMLINAVKEQHKTIEMLVKKVNEMENKQ